MSRGEWPGPWAHGSPRPYNNFAPPIKHIHIQNHCHYKLKVVRCGGGNGKLLWQHPKIVIATMGPLLLSYLHWPCENKVVQLPSQVTTQNRRWFSHSVPFDPAFFLSLSSPYIFINLEPSNEDQKANISSWSINFKNNSKSEPDLHPTITNVLNAWLHAKMTALNRILDQNYAPALLK